MDCLTSLPPEVVQRLLAKLDQKTLFCIIPFVCKSLRKQAVAVATSVEVQLCQKAAVDNFAAWVAKHGHTALASLELLADANLHVKLPFAAAAQHLQQLMVVEGRCDQHTICFEAARELTSLDFIHVTADCQLLQRIVVLTNLQSLALHNIDSGPLIDAASRQTLVAGAQLAWAHLTRLTALSVSQCDLHDAAVAGLTSSLTRLQLLDLSSNQIQQPTALLPLPQALTFLSLSNNHQHLDVSQLLASAAAATAAASQDSNSTAETADNAHSPESGPLLPEQQQQQLGALQHLEISGLVLTQPHVLTGLRSLTQLVAKELKVDNPPLLLEALAPLSCLRHLELRGVFHTRPGSVAEPAVLALALASKPHLSHLDLGQNRIYELAAADGPGASFGTALMPTPWKLPALQVLLLDCHPAHTGAEYGYPQYRMQAHDMQQLPLSCPSLQELDLRGRIHGSLRPQQLQPLLQLAGSLTSLSLGGGELGRGPAATWVVTDGALSVIRQLSCLKSLTVMNAHGVTDAGLVLLCKLKQLRELKVLGLTLNAEVVSEALVTRSRSTAERVVSLSDKRYDKPPSVWQQLLTRCNRSPACLRARQKELEEELAAAHKVAAKERKRAAAAEREAATARGEVAALRQQLAALQAANSQGSQ